MVCFRGRDVVKNGRAGIDCLDFPLPFSPCQCTVKKTKCQRTCTVCHGFESRLWNTKTRFIPELLRWMYSALPGLTGVEKSRVGGVLGSHASLQLQDDMLASDYLRWLPPRPRLTGTSHYDPRDNLVVVVKIADGTGRHSQV